MATKLQCLTAPLLLIRIGVSARSPAAIDTAATVVSRQEPSAAEEAAWEKERARLEAKLQEHSETVRRCAHSARLSWPP